MQASSHTWIQQRSASSKKPGLSCSCSTCSSAVCSLGTHGQPVFYWLCSFTCSKLYSPWLVYILCETFGTGSCSMGWRFQKISWRKIPPYHVTGWLEYWGKGQSLYSPYHHTGTTFFLHQWTCVQGCICDRGGSQRCVRTCIPYLYY